MLSTLLLGAVVTVLASPVARRQAPAGVPSYVVNYAPVVHLFSGEKYFPSDIGAQVANTHPTVNYTAVSGAPSPLTLDNLNELNNTPNSNGGKDVFLTSNSDPTTSPGPAFLYGVAPNTDGKTDGAVSSAIIVTDHHNGTVDAFYMYFYAFNYGGEYFGLIVDDHIGDWEHNMVRFVNGTPSAVWYSQHSGGQAFEYATTEKYNNGPRPVAYSANGTHANYATPGTHDHTIPHVNLPAGPIEDHTDAGGPVWDPTLSAYYYAYDPASAVFTPYDASTPVNWLYYLGAWGDAKIPESDPRQSCPFDIDALCKYAGGPTGPVDKDLDRTNVCPDGEDCPVFPVLLPRRQVDV